MHCSVSPLFKSGGLDFAQDGELNFFLKFSSLKKWAIEYLIFEIGIIFKVRLQSTKIIGCHKIDIQKRYGQADNTPIIT